MAQIIQKQNEKKKQQKSNRISKINSLNNTTVNFDPVEKNIFVVMENINVINNKYITTQFSTNNIELVINATGANIDGRISDLIPGQKSFNDKRSYIALLSESTAVVNLYPKQKYATFFISTCGSPNPVYSIEPMIYLFQPKRAEVRVFTSSSIDSILEIPQNKAKFWKEFNRKNIPYFYEVSQMERDKNGIYFDLKNRLYETVEEHNVNAETSIIVSMYEISMNVIKNFNKTHSKKSIEDAILKTDEKIYGLMSKEFPALDGSDFNGFSYIASLRNGAYAFHLTPEKKYASFYFSKSDNKIYYSMINDMLNYFKPNYAEIRVFGSKELPMFDYEKLLKNYKIKNIELIGKEYYIDVNKVVRN